MLSIITIAGININRGEDAHVNLNIARLPTRTPIDIPVYVSRSKKPGPVLLLNAGLHGDEINGMEILRRILRKGYSKPDKGTTIIIPVLNIYGFLNYSRDVPDGKDVNRSFPGNPNGSLASRVAWHLMNEILPLIDLGIDFHTGGASRANFPQVRCLLGDKVNKELAMAFAPSFIINSPYRPDSLRKEAANLGKRIIVFEGGEALRFDRIAIDEGVNGARRVMHHLGMVSEAPPPVNTPVLVMKTTWIRAKYSGLFHYYIQNGKKVNKHQLVGSITDPFGEFFYKIQSPADGFLIGVNNNPVVSQGDALMHIGIA